MSTPRMFAFLSVVALAAAGCGDNHPATRDAAPGDAGPDASPDASPLGPIALADLPAALQDAVCELDVRCGMMPDLVSCRAVFDPATTDIAQLAAYVATGNLTYDATKAGACLTAYRDAACAWTPGGLGPDPICRDVFRGDKPAGVTCLLDEECTGDSYCETAACATGCCTGTCRPKTAAVALGGDCTGAPCGEGAYCRFDGAGAATCTAVAAAGEECTTVDGCATGAVCDLDPSSGHGACVALAGAGQACKPSVAVGSCVGIDRWCDPASSTCALRKAIGASCSGEGQCIEAAACVAGTCTARPRPGAACGAQATGGDCLGELPCVSGVCTATAVEGVCP